MTVSQEKKATDVKNIKKKSVTLKKKKSDAIVATKNANIAYNVLIEPWITEKTHSEISLNKYTFKVSRTATKGQVIKAIEGMYDVKIEKIAVINIKPKLKAYGRHTRKQAGIRKAIVTLKEGDKIELFKGV